MLLTPLTVVAGLLALPANAFLIPPEVSDADVQVANTIESIGAPVPDGQVVEVACPSCPVLVHGHRGQPIQLKTHRPSHLELTFSVDSLPDHDRLLVNGFELYPSGNPLRETLLAPQVIDRKEKRHEREHDHHNDGMRSHRKGTQRLVPQPQRLGFGLHVGPAQKAADSQFVIVEVELQIIEVGSTFIDNIPNVKVKLVQDGEGRILMAQIEKGASKKLVESPNGDVTEECTTMLCKWLAAVKEKLKIVKGFGHCHKGGNMEGAMNPAHGGAGEQSHPHPHHPHPLQEGAEHWHARYPERRWGKLFKYIVAHILLPVLIGIVAGVSISLIGMAVGTVTVSLWRFFFRRRRSSSISSHRRHHSGHTHHHKAARKEAAGSDEKSGLMEHQDPPPSYEEEDTVKPAQV
ncbi:hypothetical protein C8A05DRAFT_40623 [Staphylotrichum tortipilum]|uniref:DUF7728 domain-containing protein n=1 Tax=Staphylotrichum tortipilum TaxID=2831512 RepID=A0AAN6MVV9_9PEZI|nr:hypothetical protein C8A05DRAFT_40623 [Staphylotrichum longicolle]